MTTTNDRSASRPPAWAEDLLRLLLRPADRDSVSGDLLEEYRDAIVPARGSRAADRWYILQAGGFLWRATWAWALLFAGAFIARTAYDWFVPTHDFGARSAATTWIAVTIIVSVSFSAAWRSRSFGAGLLTAILVSQIAALMSVAGAALLLAIWHDPQTQQAIVGSGGLGEVFALPFMMVIPAAIVGVVGALLGKLAAVLYGFSSPNTNSA
jgi:hypothetical protein